MGGIAGVPPREVIGVGGRNESVADSAGDGIIMLGGGPVGIAMRGAGWAIELLLPDEDFVGDGGAAGVAAGEDGGGLVTEEMVGSRLAATRAMGRVH